MSDYVPEKSVQRGSLLTFFHLKKSATEAHQLLVEAYGSRAMGQRTCYEWYEKFKAGNFDLHEKIEKGPSKKVLLCVWWDQLGVIYHELLKPGETVTKDRYQRQLTNVARALTLKRPETESRHEKVILLHDNAPAHTANDTRNMLAKLKWEILPHPPYSPDLAPSDYHLFASLGHAVSNQHFKTFAEAEKWVVDWFASKDEAFYRKGIRNLPERWAECIANNGSYFE